MMAAGVVAGLALLGVLIGREVSAVGGVTAVRSNRATVGAIGLLMVAAAVLILPRLVDLLT